MGGAGRVVVAGRHHVGDSTYEGFDLLLYFIYNCSCFLMVILGSILNTISQSIMNTMVNSLSYFMLSLIMSRSINVETKMVSEVCCVNVLFAVIHMCVWVSGKEEIE